MIRKRHFCLVGIVATCSLLLVYCSRGPASSPSTHQRNPNGTVMLSGPSAAYVQTEPAGASNRQQSRWLSGQVTFDERKVARIGPQVQGRVTSIKVITGDKVKKGDVLVTIHSADIAAAQAQVNETRTSRVLAEQTAARAALLAQQGAGSDAERLQAEAALAQAKQEERRAQAALSAIGGGQGGSEYELRSPIDGTVVERNVAIGNEVHADQDQPLMTVADLSTVWIVADVYETDLPLVHNGDAAKVEIQAYPGRDFTGSITHVGEVFDQATRVAKARVELGNTDAALRPGMFARVEVKGQSQGTSVVPISAILARRDQFFVFIRNSDGSYARREVKLGEQNGQHVTLLSGIQPGEPVVTEGAILLDAEANEAL